MKGLESPSPPARPQSYTHLHSILKKNQLFLEIKEALWFKLGFLRVQARSAELTGCLEELQKQEVEGSGSGLGLWQWYRGEGRGAEVSSLKVNLFYV